MTVTTSRDRATRFGDWYEAVDAAARSGYPSARVLEVSPGTFVVQIPGAFGTFDYLSDTKPL